MRAHIELYRGFLATPATHMMVVSETCVPLTHPNQALNALLKPGKTTWINRTKQAGWIRPVHRTGKANSWRVTHPETFKHLTFHEQWYCISREHAALLLENEANLIKWFGTCNADNETFLGTALHMLGRGGEMIDKQITFCSWQGGAPHPRQFGAVDRQLHLQAMQKGSLFMRKIVPNANLEYLHSHITGIPMAKRNAKPTTNAAALQPKQAETPAKIYWAVLTVGYYARLLHLASAIKDLVVHSFESKPTMPEGLTVVEMTNPNYYTANFAAIANAALVAAPDAEYIAVFSDDIVLPDNFSETVAQRIAGLDNVGIYSAVFNSAHDVTLVKHGKSGVELVPYVEFTAPIIRRDVLEALLLEWPYKMHKGWGVDFWACLKARELGTNVYADHDVQFYHEGAKTNEVTSGSKQAYYDQAAKEMFEGMREAFGIGWQNKVTEGFPQRLPGWMY
jgi:hypothetical protein